MVSDMFCRACGLRCMPLVKQPAVLPFEFVSDCCGVRVSEEPVTPQCGACGEVAHVDDLADTIQEVDGVLMCQSCHRDYRKDHPDMENVISLAEYREDR